MKPFARNSISDHVAHYLERAYAFMNYIPEPELETDDFAIDYVYEKSPNKPVLKYQKRIWSCHDLTRAFSKIYPNWTVVDGYFQRRGTYHSWLYVVEKNPIILDLYPVGGIAPFMVDASPMLAWSHLYIEASMYYTPQDLEKYNHAASHAVDLWKRYVKTGK